MLIITLCDRDTRGLRFSMCLILTFTWARSDSSSRLAKYLFFFFNRMQVKKAIAAATLLVNYADEREKAGLDG